MAKKNNELGDPVLFNPEGLEEPEVISSEPLDEKLKDKKEEKKKDENPKPPRSPRKGKTSSESTSSSNSNISSSKDEPEVLQVDQLKEDTKKNTIIMDFMNADESEEFIEKKTNSRSKITPDEKENSQSTGQSNEKSSFEGKSTEEIREQILKEEQEKTNNFKASDYEDIAKLLVNIIDLLMSSLLKWFAKDSSDTAYSLNAQKKQTVSYQLALLMIKHQKKMSIEIIFCLTLVAVYAGPVMAAVSNRKKVKEKETRGPGKPKKN